MKTKMGKVMSFLICVHLLSHITPPLESIKIFLVISIFYYRGIFETHCQSVLCFLIWVTQCCVLKNVLTQKRQNKIWAQSHLILNDCKKDILVYKHMFLYLSYFKYMPSIIVFRYSKKTWLIWTTCFHSSSMCYCIVLADVGVGQHFDSRILIFWKKKGSDHWMVMTTILWTRNERC